jgi:UDP-glucuronate 4-epimerase
MTDNQLSLYGQNKKDNEMMANTYHNLYGTHSTGLRFFTVYGPWGRPDMALFLFTDALLHDRTLQVFGEGKMQRDFTYVDDIADGIIVSIDKNYENEVFNLGCGRQEELMEYIRMVEVTCGKEATKEYLPMQPGDVRASMADISKAQKMLGFDPKTQIKDGVPQFVRWYREYYGV